MDQRVTEGGCGGEVARFAGGEEDVEEVFEELAWGGRGGGV